MNMTKVCNTITTAIDCRPMLDGKSFLLVWRPEGVRCITPGNKTKEMKLIARLTNSDCENGLTGTRWDAVIKKTMDCIQTAGKESDFGY